MIKSFYKMKWQFLQLIYFKIIVALICLSGCNTPAIEKKQHLNNNVANDSLFEFNPDMNMDSLLLLIANAPLDTNIAMIYHQIGEMYEDSDFEKAKDCYLKMGKISDQLNWNKGRYIYTVDYSHMLVREGIIDSAIILNSHALELAKNEDDEYWICRINYSLGNAYLLKQWFDLSLEHYMKALAIFEKKNDFERLGSVYSQLCQLYTDINVAEKALEFGRKSVILNHDCPYSLTSLAQVYSSINQYEKAIIYLEEALRLCLLQDNVYLTGVIYYHMGNNYLRVFDLKKTEKYALKALEVNREIGNSIAYVGALTLLSKLEKLKGNIVQAEKYISEALQIAIEINTLEGKNNCYMILAELAMVQHKYQENLQYWEKWEDVNKEIASEITLRTTAEMEAKYESKKKELEIVRQKTIIEKQKMQQVFFVWGVVFCVIFILLLGFMLRLRTRRNLVLIDMNTTKDKFFSIISHDLKNPALAQRNALKILLENVELWDKNTIKQYCQQLFTSSNGQVELLYNLLNWAQLQTGRMPFIPVQFDLAAELRKTTISLFSDMANRKGIEFIVEMPEIVIINGDVNMITTIIRNLLDNAIKFTPTGGTVTLNISSCACRNPSTSAEKKYILSVFDTGNGMTEEQIQHLFRLGRTKGKGSEHQISKKGTAGEKGAGIGLIVCKELLEKHGTALHVESKLNEGSCFWFEL